MSQIYQLRADIYPPGTVVQTLSDTAGTLVMPDAGNNIQLFGVSPNILVTAVPLNNRLTFALANDVVTNSYATSNATTSLTIVNNTISSSGSDTNVNINLDPQGTGNAVLLSGNLNISAGNLNLPTTSATAGVININNIRYFHGKGGSGNIFAGQLAGNLTTTAQSSVGIGSSTLSALTTGNQNTAVGAQSMVNATTAASNTAIGNNTLSQVTTTSSENTVVGTNAGSGLTGGTRHTAVGSDALNNALTAGSTNNIAIGYIAGSSQTGTDSNCINIGNVGQSGVSGFVNIGTSGTHTRMNLAAVYHTDLNTVEVTTVNSDGRLGSATLTAGTGVTIGTATGQITISSSGADLDYNYYGASTTPFDPASDAQFIAVATSSAAITVRLPDAPVSGRWYIIKDGQGNASVNNITVTTVGGAVTIDGATTFVMNTNWQSASFLYDGSNYLVY